MAEPDSKEKTTQTFAFSLLFSIFLQNCYCDCCVFSGIREVSLRIEICNDILMINGFVSTQGIDTVFGLSFFLATTFTSFYVF